MNSEEGTWVDVGGSRDGTAMRAELRPLILLIAVDFCLLLHHSSNALSSSASQTNLGLGRGGCPLIDRDFLGLIY